MWRASIVNIIIYFLVSCGAYDRNPRPSEAPGGSDDNFALIYNDSRIVPVDFQSLNVDMKIDLLSEKLQASAILKFKTIYDGYPLIHLFADIKGIKLDGKFLNPHELKVEKFDLGNSIGFLSEKLVGEQEYELEFDYEILPEYASVKNGTVDFGLFMSDLAPVFLERYVPASLELDQFPLNLQLRVTESDTRHNIYTNGKILKNEGVNWSVQFPKHFGGSCHFFHVSGNEFKTLESHYISIDGRTVPIVIYGQSETQKAALESAQSSLSKLEQLFGPYPHDKLLMYLAYPDDWGGGMEYCGAIKTSLFAISHEIAHQWFGRGVLSSDGNSGWIDEAIATWIDNRMPADSRACLTLQEPTNLANHSPFSRVTPLEAYSTGARIMECIAGRLDAAKALSLTQVLRELVGEYKFRPLSTKAFQEFIQNKTSHNFESVFQTSVYGY